MKHVSAQAYIDVPRLIETWDVLKLYEPVSPLAAYVWLIETWDVLKHVSAQAYIDVPRLIETWDVLKLRTQPLSVSALWINRNMRCIET